MGVLEQFSLVDKKAVVTGGEGLLGKAICETVRELGGEAISVDLKPTADTVLDITNGPSVQAFVDAHTDIDILVNCAVGNQKPVHDVGKDFWQDCAVGLMGAYNMSAAFGLPMSKRKDCVVLNIGSDLSLIAPDPWLYEQGVFKPASYSVVKHGIVGMTRYFAAAWGAAIRCNCLCPGGIEQGQKIPHLPMGRLAKLEEMKGPVAFLISQASSYMTGSIVVVDGGRTSW